MNERTYWNGNGKAQDKYNEMEAAGFKYTKASESAFHTYHRYYNDGDFPSWARARWDITENSRSGSGHTQRVLTDAGKEEFEHRITERIEIEYDRFKNTL